MIINREKAFAFVHIPKCAGTSVRRQLIAAHDLPQRFDEKMDHPDLGRIHLAHLPLWAIRDHFPEAFEALRACRSFAVIREPHARFASAVSQYLMLNHRKRIGQYDPEALSRVVSDIIESISLNPVFADARHCHFIRQSDFIAINGEMVVRQLYTLESLDRMMKDMARYTGFSFDSSFHENQTLYFRSIWTETAFRRISGLAFRVLPRRIYARAKRAAKVIIARENDNRHDAVLRSTQVRHFVDAFYADDVQLYHALSTGSDAQWTSNIHV